MSLKKYFCIILQYLIYLTFPNFILSSEASLDYFWQHDPQIFKFWSTLTTDQQLAFKAQLNQIDIEILKKQKKLIQEPIIIETQVFEAFNDFAFSGNLNYQHQGEKLIEEGRLGCLLLAGGQGTRLQYSKVKGTYPISIIKQKSLFQLCAEKIKAASQKAGRLLNLAIMTSSDNDVETRDFFRQNHFFGLNPCQISFFIQSSLPLLNENGNLFLKNSWQINSGADGNGHSLLYFAQSGILDNWVQQGIEYVHVIVIDNPLADPFDAELLGFHHEKGVDITLKCTEKSKPEEKVGVLVKQNDHCKVVEYSEISEKEKNKCRPDGRLKHCCANLSLFCFSLSYIKHLALLGEFLPLHKAWKATQYTNNQGKTCFSDCPIAWKFETFIFDWLTHTKKVAAFICPREECFAPLKNAKGIDSPETVRIALQQMDKKIIQALTDLPPPDFSFELAADFYYPTDDLKAKWYRRSVTTSYVEP